jgi:CDP-diglyceride synthetase
MSSLATLCLILLPVVLGGVLNMVWVKLPLMKALKIPIDAGKTMKDGHRLFGDNKTWKGFIGMILFTSLSAGFLLTVFGSAYDNLTIGIVPYGADFLGASYVYGAILGLFYVLFELPNSYIKRRINIQPGTNGSGIAGKLFTVVDQADSVIGCAVALLLFSRINLIDFWALIIIGTVAHYVINILLYFGRLKSQAG